MADDRTEDIGPSPDLGRSKREPPTIDLAATDVTEARPEPETATDSKPAEFKPEAEPASLKPRALWISTALIPALSGASAAAIVVALAWLAGWPGTSSSEPVVQPVTAAMMDDLSARVARVESKPAPAIDPTLKTRIDALEKSAATLSDGLAKLRMQSDQLAGTIKDVKAAPRETLVAPDMSGISDRLTQIERAASALTSETAKQNAKPADDTQLRRVVAASMLDSVVRQGEPYAAALAAAKPLAADANALKPLDVFATSGLPNANVLSREAVALLPKLAPTEETVASSGGIVDRLQAGAARLVRIQRTDAVSGDDRSSIASRAAAAALRNDIVGTRRELMALSPADRTPVQAWIDRVDARDAALAASRQFAADAMAALSKPAP